MNELISPPKLAPGDRIAVLSPSFAAPGFAPVVHEQAMRRLAQATGLEVLEYPTTRQLGAAPRARATDLNAAFADPGVRAILASIGGEDQITVIPHLDPTPLAADPKIFLGYSDSTNLLNWLWCHGVRAFHGGSSQVHLGPGPELDSIHLRSLRAALLDGGTLQLSEPGVAEDFGVDWLDPLALSQFGDREPTQPWTWAGPRRRVSGPTWGGCIEIIDWLALAGRLPPPERLDGTVLLVETSEELPAATQVSRWLRALGEGGYLGACVAVLLARPVTSNREYRPDGAARADARARLTDAVIEQVGRYNPDAVVCAGVPFGHSRPQWIVPYGGPITLDGVTQSITASYD